MTTPIKLKKYFEEMGRKGGNAKAKKLTAEDRKKIGQRLAKARARARKKKEK